MNCYNCGKPFGEHETVEMSQKYMDDNQIRIWIGSRDYPNGLCHIYCGRLYANKQDIGKQYNKKATARNQPLWTQNDAEELIEKTWKDGL